MRAILEFNLPEDNEEHIAAINGMNYKIAIFNFDQWLRSEMKYQGKSEISIETAREYLRQELVKFNVGGSVYE